MDNASQPNSAPKLDDNLNQENWEESLKISQPIDMPAPETLVENELTENKDREPQINQLNPEILSAASLETSPNKEEAKEVNRESLSDDILKKADPTDNLGQITTLENAISVTGVSNHSGYNPALLKTSGDHLEKDAIKEIQKAEIKLSETHELTPFYDEIRGENGMLYTHLDNSFENKFYGNQDKGAA